MSDLGEMPARAEGVAITDISGNITSQQRYLPFGQVRTLSIPPNSPITQTDLGYTGQRQLDGGMGRLMDYHARFYDPYLNHFTQPDTITLGGPQGLNRYSYVLNTPINAIDPSGHICIGEPDECLKDDGTTGSGFTGTGGASNSKVGKKNKNNNPKSSLGDILGLNKDSGSACTEDYDYGYCTSAKGLSSPSPSMPTNSTHIDRAWDWISHGIELAEAMHWIHAPIVGIYIDANLQSADDKGKGYTEDQETVRVWLSVGEGQLSSFAGAATAGVDAIPGAITGPADVIIIGGSYLTGSAIASFWLKVANNTLVHDYPSVKGYVPETLFPFAQSNGSIKWCYGTIYTSGC